MVNLVIWLEISHRANSDGWWCGVCYFMLSDLKRILADQSQHNSTYIRSRRQKTQKRFFQRKFYSTYYLHIFDSMWVNTDIGYTVQLFYPVNVFYADCWFPILNLAISICTSISFHFNWWMDFFSSSPSKIMVEVSWALIHVCSRDEYSLIWLFWRWKWHKLRKRRVLWATVYWQRLTVLPVNFSLRIFAEWYCGFFYFNFEYV